MSYIRIGDVGVDVPHFGDGRTYHLAAIWDGGKMVVYINGERQ